MEYSFGGVDNRGNIRCNNCGEYTNASYIIVQDLSCWNCDVQMLDSHAHIIKDLQNWIVKNNE